MSKTPTPPPPHTPGDDCDSCEQCRDNDCCCFAGVTHRETLHRENAALEAEVERLKADNKDLGKEVTIWRQLHPEQTATVLLAIPLRVGGEAALARDREKGGT